MTIFFPDVSNHNTVKIEPGTPALSAKATEGSTFTDAKYQQYKAQAKAVGAVFQAYHWLWSSSDAEVQHCFSVVGPDVPLHLDSENTVVKNTVAMQLEFVRKYRALGGTVQGTYLPHWYWEGHLGSPDLRPLENAGLYLISSNYTAYSDNGPGWDPYGGITPKQWQFSDHHSYGGSFVDFSAFKGTAAEYKTLITGGKTLQLDQEDRDWIKAQLDTIEGDVFKHVVTQDAAGGDVTFNELSRGLRARSLTTADALAQIEAAVEAIPAPVGGLTKADVIAAVRKVFGDAAVATP